MPDQVVEQSPAPASTPTPEQVAQEGEAAFESGFTSARESTPAPAVEKPEPKVEGKAKETSAQKPVATTPAKAAAAAQSAAAAEPDPWEGVPIGIKRAFESVDARLKAVDQIDHRVKSFEGRLGGINKAIEQLAAARAATAVSNAPSQAQIDAAQKSDARWKQLKEDYPDWTEALDEKLTQLRAAIPAATTVDVEAIKKEVTALTKEQLAEMKTEARQLARVDSKHEDWEATVNSPEFKTWFETQAPEVKALADSHNAKDAIKMLDAFTAAQKAATAAAAAAKEKAEKAATNKQRLSAATTPQGVPAPVVSSIGDEEAFAEGFKSVRAG